MALITPKNIATSKLTDGSNFLTGISGADLPAGTIVKSETFRPDISGGELTVSTNADVQWWSQTFTTVRANSRILITYHSGQIGANTTSNAFNARVFWSCNSTQSGGNIQHHRDHNHEWYQLGGGTSDKRFFVSGQATTSTLSIGTHTVRAFAGAYNQQLVFFHQAGNTNRSPIITFQEIAT